MKASRPLSESFGYAPFDSAIGFDDDVRNPQCFEPSREFQCSVKSSGHFEPPRYAVEDWNMNCLINFFAEIGLGKHGLLDSLQDY
ncbi:hypothetical protein NPIL_257061 [Nephila pilipes]|uniref:Uncharacterized protein n=1 Tax=Nephila pilipes TaxID=299642 RepID=A0A8X6TIJ6_NEPPI|nr:hypothetical protein NPIL_257061 [Nephila pilipes]